MIDYSLHPCSVCQRASVGLMMDANPLGGWITKHYCNSHWYARKSVDDKAQDAREHEQWKHLKWYQEAYPERFGDPLESLGNRVKAKKAQMLEKRKPIQQSLF